MKAESTEFDALVRSGLLEIGDGYRAKNAELGGNGPIFLRAAYLQDEGFILDNPDRFNERAPKTFGPKVAELDDVVITTKGNSTGRVGRIYQQQVGSIYSPHLSYWRSKDQRKIDQRFLFYWSKGIEFQTQLAGMAASTDMAPYLSLRDQLRLHITLPDIVDQRATGTILGALDDKIDLNRRMNESLEATARAIFKDWFVDFGPTQAKMEGRAPYLAPEIWALFPNRLDNESKPEGWELTPLDQIARFLNGLALQKYPATIAGYLPVIKIAELRAGSVEGSDKASIQIPADYIVEDGDVLFSWSGSLMHRVWTGGRGALNQHLFKVTSAQVPKWFFFHWIGHHMEEFRATAAAKATTMGHIQRHHLAQAMTTVPSENIMAAAHEIIGPLFERGLANDLESRALAATRDLLLPKLMSGEIRLKDTENVAEAAA
jgi:type I restriction enzyme S subunit